jgi:hypothetical protein
LQKKIKSPAQLTKRKTKPNNFSSRQKEKKAATENRKKKRRSNDTNSNRYNRNQNPNTMHTTRPSPPQAEDDESSQLTSLLHIKPQRRIYKTNKTKRCKVAYGFADPGVRFGSVRCDPN